MVRRVGVLILCISIFLPVFVHGVEKNNKGPVETVQFYIDKVLEIIKEHPTDKKQETMNRDLKQELKEVAEEIFNFYLMSRMSIGPKWNDLNENQQKDFVDLFTQLIEDNYFNKMQKYLGEIKEFDQDLIYIKDKTIYSERKAEVQSIIEYQDKEIPVDYRMVSYKDGWKIYDIRVEGVSLVQNYRSQFKDILLRKSPQEMLDLLREKIEEGETSEINS